MSKGIILVIIMISCGIIGGLTVYISDFKNKFILNELIEKILYAVIASFLVPLFLNTISSNLINEIGTTIQSTYIFIGFCLIASLSSKAFITSLAEKTIKNITKKVNDTQNDLEKFKEVVEVKNTDTSLELEDDTNKIDVVRNNNAYSTSADDIENNLLLEFGKNPKTFISSKFLSERFGMSSASIIRRLNLMENKGIIISVNFGKRTNYALSAEGKKEYTKLINSIEWEIKEINKQSIIADSKYIFDIITEGNSNKHKFEVYSGNENINLEQGDIITVKTVDGNKVDIKYVKKINIV